MRRKIKKVLDEKVNPYVASHGGQIDVLDFANGDVFLRMSGGCQGCSSSSATLRQGVEEALREAFGSRIRQVIDVTDHAAGHNPYYS